METRLADNEDPARQPRQLAKTNRVPPDQFSFLANDDRIIEPKCSENVQGMKNPNERQKWIRATEDERQSMLTNKTWELVVPSPGRKMIGYKWTFMAKYNAKGEIKKYKTHL